MTNTKEFTPSAGMNSHIDCSTIELPADLLAFLTAERQLEYDAKLCEAGAVRLVTRAQLKTEYFPVETQSLDVYAQDPHYPELNSYLVLGVNLIAECTGGYDAAGLLLWLPVERRYGIWDSSHCGIRVFGPEVTWTIIAASPAAHINAGWRGIDDTSPPTMDLAPWPAHPYHDRQVFEPQPASSC